MRTAGNLLNPKGVIVGPVFTVQVFDTLTDLLYGCLNIVGQPGIGKRLITCELNRFHNRLDGRLNVLVLLWKIGLFFIQRSIF